MNHSRAKNSKTKNADACVCKGSTYTYFFRCCQNSKNRLFRFTLIHTFCMYEANRIVSSTWEVVVASSSFIIVVEYLNVWASVVVVACERYMSEWARQWIAQECWRWLLFNVYIAKSKLLNLGNEVAEIFFVSVASSWNCHEFCGESVTRLLTGGSEENLFNYCLYFINYD